MKKLMVTSIITAIAGLLAGCLSTPVTIAASTDPIEQGKYTILGSEVSGTDTQLGFLFFTFGKRGSCTRRAIEDAIAQAPGSDALVRVALEDEYFSLIVFSFYKVRVTGTPIKTSKN